MQKKRGDEKKNVGRNHPPAEMLHWIQAIGILLPSIFEDIRFLLGEDLYSGIKSKKAILSTQAV